MQNRNQNMIQENKASMTNSRVYLNSPILWYPKKNCEYYVGETKVIFLDDDASNITMIDLSSGLYISKSSELSYKIFDKYAYLFVSTTSLFTESSSLYGFVNDTPFMFTDIQFTHNGSSFSYDSVLVPYFLGNQFIQQIAQKCVPDIPISSGKYPIYIRNSASLKKIEALYEKFIEHNDDKKLEYQFKNSKSRCYVRAHFLKLCLEKYGIQTFKIFKYWEPQSWESFPEKQAWHYHCALILLDSNNYFWIWDPWVGNHKKLLTLKEWLKPNDEPIPTHAKITNDLIVDTSMTETPWPNFRFFARRGEWRAMQAVAADALPNPPEMPIGYINHKISMLDAMLINSEKKVDKLNTKKSIESIYFLRIRGLFQSKNRTGNFLSVIVSNLTDRGKLQI